MQQQFNRIKEAYEHGVIKCDEKFKNDLIGGSKHIRSFALLTAENPFVQRLPRTANKERNNRLEELLKNGGYVFRKVIGQYGNKEHSYCVYNISLESAKEISARFNQQSFVFGKINNEADFDDDYRGNRMTYSFYAYRQKQYDIALEKFKSLNDGITDEFYKKYPKFDPSLYVKVDERDNFVDNDDYFSRKNNFKFNIPFEFFNDEEAMAAGHKIDECARRIGEERFSRMLEESIDDRFTGRHQYQNRIMMYGNKDRHPLKDFVPLDEASLNHILRKDKYDEGYVIVSACRGDWDDDPQENRHQNNLKTMELKRDAKDAGFGFIPVYGGFIENKGEKNARDVFERSLMVFPFDNRGNQLPFADLMAWAKKMGRKYNQDSVLIKEPTIDGDVKAPYYFVTTTRGSDTLGDKQEWFGKDTYKVNDIAQEYFTSMRKKTRRHEHDDNPRRFSLVESVYVEKDPMCYSGAHSRFMSGEIVNYHQ